MCILALDLSTTNEVCVSAPLFHFGRRRLGRLSGTPRVDYWSNISSVSGSRSGASCGACWPPSITPLDPSIRHPLLALNVQRRDVVPAASTPTELGIQPIGLADSDLRTLEHRSRLDQTLYRPINLRPIHLQIPRTQPDSW